MVLAADEARNLGHDRIGTEHLLLGLVRLGDPATADLGLTLSGARESVKKVVGGGRGQRTIGELRFTDAAKRVLQRADDAAGTEGSGPAELLAALLGERESGAVALVGALAGESDGGDDGDELLGLAGDPLTVTARALAALGIDTERLRRAVEDVRRRSPGARPGARV